MITFLLVTGVVVLSAILPPTIRTICFTLKI
jgi:hypothetical protein